MHTKLTTHNTIDIFHRNAMQGGKGDKDPKDAVADAWEQARLDAEAEKQRKFAAKRGGGGGGVRNSHGASRLWAEEGQAARQAG